jgi:hypothetical protein
MSGKMCGAPSLFDNIINNGNQLKMNVGILVENLSKKYQIMHLEAKENLSLNGSMNMDWLKELYDRDENLSLNLDDGNVN